MASPSSALAAVDDTRAQQHRDGAQEDAQVERQRAVLDVPDVELDALGPRERRAAVDLRPAGQARPDLEPAALAVRVVLDLVARASGAGPRGSSRRAGRCRAGAARRATAAQQRADARDARVAPVDRVAGALRAGVRRPSCAASAPRRGAVLADALLAEEDRARRPRAGPRPRRRASTGAARPGRARAPRTSSARLASPALIACPPPAPRRAVTPVSRPRQRDHGRRRDEQVVVRQASRRHAAAREARSERPRASSACAAEHPPVDAALARARARSTSRAARRAAGRSRSAAAGARPSRPSRPGRAAQARASRPRARASQQCAEHPHLAAGTRPRGRSSASRTAIASGS